MAKIIQFDKALERKQENEAIAKIDEIHEVLTNLPEMPMMQGVQASIDRTLDYISWSHELATTIKRNKQPLGFFSNPKLEPLRNLIVRKFPKWQTLGDFVKSYAQFGNLVITTPKPLDTHNMRLERLHGKPGGPLYLWVYLRPNDKLEKAFKDAGEQVWPAMLLRECCEVIESGEFRPDNYWVAALFEIENSAQWIADNPNK